MQRSSALKLLRIKACAIATYRIQRCNRFKSRYRSRDDSSLGKQYAGRWVTVLHIRVLCLSLLSVDSWTRQVNYKNVIGVHNAELLPNAINYIFSWCEIVFWVYILSVQNKHRWKCSDQFLVYYVCACRCATF